MGYAAEGGTIEISTEVDLERPPVVRVYDVRDLLAAPTDDPWADPAATSPGGVQAVDALIRIVETDAASHSWKSNGGPWGATQYLAGRLVVVQSPGNHREIARLLEQLRHPQRQSPPSPDVRVWDEGIRSYVGSEHLAGESSLRRRLAGFRCDAVPLDRALSNLAEASGAGLLPAWSEIGEAGVRRDQPVTLDVRDVTVAQALRAVLDAATATTGGNLDFAPVVGHVIVTRSDSRRLRFTRIYDVRDRLVAAIGPPPPGRGPEQAAWQAAKDAAVGRLIPAVIAAVGVSNTDPGFREWDGRLIVTQDWDAQERIAGVLEALGREPVRPNAGPATRPGNVVP